LDIVANTSGQVYYKTGCSVGSSAARRGTAVTFLAKISAAFANSASVRASSLVGDAPTLLQYAQQLAAAFNVTLAQLTTADFSIAAPAVVPHCTQGSYSDCSGNGRCQYAQSSGNETQTQSRTLECACNKTNGDANKRVQFLGEYCQYPCPLAKELPPPPPQLGITPVALYEQVFDDIAGVPCNHEANLQSQCVMNAAQNGAKCNLCPSGWKGNACEQRQKCPYVNALLCFGHGACSKSYCTCNPDWANYDCSLYVGNDAARSVQASFFFMAMIVAAAAVAATL